MGWGQEEDDSLLPSWVSWRGHFLCQEEEQPREAVGSSVVRPAQIGSSPPAAINTETYTGLLSEIINRVWIRTTQFALGLL